MRKLLKKKKKRGGRTTDSGPGPPTKVKENWGKNTMIGKGQGSIVETLPFWESLKKTSEGQSRPCSKARDCQKKFIVPWASHVKHNARPKGR